MNELEIVVRFGESAIELKGESTDVHKIFNEICGGKLDGLLDRTPLRSIPNEIVDSIDDERCKKIPSKQKKRRKPNSSSQIPLIDDFEYNEDDFQLFIKDVPDNAILLAVASVYYLQKNKQDNISNYMINKMCKDLGRLGVDHKKGFSNATTNGYLTTDNDGVKLTAKGKTYLSKNGMQS